jgi:hypothetical protein
LLTSQIADEVLGSAFPLLPYPLCRHPLVCFSCSSLNITQDFDPADAAWQRLPPAPSRKSWIEIYGLANRVQYTVAAESYFPSHVFIFFSVVAAILSTHLFVLFQSSRHFLSHRSSLNIGEEAASSEAAFTSTKDSEKARAPTLAASKEQWTSDDTADENILDRFLKVKQFGEIKIPSYDSKCINVGI